MESILFKDEKDGITVLDHFIQSFIYIQMLSL